MKGKVIQKWRGGIFLSFLLISFFTYSVSADSSNTEKLAGFSVKAILPDNQIDTKLSYYYLKVSPGDQQTVSVLIQNMSSEEMTYFIHVNPALTNSNGLIIYTEDSEEPHESMKFPLNTIVAPHESEVTIPANEEKQVAFDINVPEETFDGIILGGIHIGIQENEEDPAESKPGMGVTNTYGYVIGMILTQDEETPVRGNTDIELAGVVPYVDYGSRVLEASILNPNPEIFENLQIEGKIYKKGSTKVVAEHEQENINIAPNTIFPFQISFGKKDVEPGTYVFKGKGTSGEKEWVFEEEFTITDEQVKAMNEEATIRLVTPTWVIPSVIILGIATLGAGSILTWRFIRRKNEEEKPIAKE